MNADTLIARARSALGKKTKYTSPGETPPLNAASWPSSGASIDCSGFVAWCLRIERLIDHPGYKKVNGGWFETSGVYADGKASWGFCDALETPVPGCLVVYPDYKDSTGKSHDGHIGIVTSVNGQAGIVGVETVIHCSYGNGQKGDAVQETAPAPWKAHPESIAVWWISVEQ